MFNKINSSLKWFSLWCHKLSVYVALPLMAIFVAAGVIMRYFFHKPLIWGDELNGYLLFLTLVLSLTYTWDVDKHIRMDIFYVKFKPKFKRFADLVGSLAGIIFFGLLAIQSFKDIPYMAQVNETGEEIAVSLWIFRAVLGVISIMFTFKLFYDLIYGKSSPDLGDGVIEREGVIIRTGE